MRALVFGTGSVGLSVAASLIRSQCTVDVIARGNSTQILQNGFGMTGVLGQYHVSPNKIRLFKTISEIENTKYDCILTCTKATSNQNTSEQLDSYRSIWTKKTKLIIFQNGWGNNEVFEQYFDKENIYSAAIYCGFTRSEPNISEVTACAGDTYIGNIYGAMDGLIINLCSAMSSGGIPCATTMEIAEHLWSKMLYNCTINPLSALFNVLNGELEHSDDAQTLIRAVLNEIFQVIKAASFRTKWSTFEEYYEFLMTKLLPISRMHKSSMLYDVSNNNTTEIDVLNGAIIRLAKKYNMQVPYNEAIYHAIKFLEKRTR